MVNVDAQTTIIDNIVMINALNTTFSGIFRLNAVQCWFVAVLLIILRSTNNVLVLMPPPVEPGEAPINISIVRINSPAEVKLPIGYVENPAVLAETL